MTHGGRWVQRIVGHVGICLRALVKNAFVLLFYFSKTMQGIMLINKFVIPVGV